MSIAARSYEDPEKKAALEKEAAKVLKKLGWPSTENVSHPREILTKAKTCLTKRMAMIDEAREDLKKATKKKDDDKGIAMTTSGKSLT